MLNFLKNLFKKKPSYWDLVDPYWFVVSIYDGPFIFLREFNKLPEKSKHLFATHWLQSEVNNGGFGQFCSNATGILAPEAYEGFLAIGMPKTASAIKLYLDFFGDNYPRDQEERDDIWFKLSEERFGLDEHGDTLGGDFEDVDEVFFLHFATENGGFNKAADTYAGVI